MEAELQLLYVLSWLVLLKFLQLALEPLLRPGLGRFASPASYPAGVLSFSALAWYLGLLRLPVSLAALPFLGLIVWGLARKRYSLEEQKKNLRWDLVFFLAFGALLAVRFANPAILGAEKFMDHAFIASLMRSPVVPPPDPWYAGGTMNIYYYGGYWMAGVLGILAGVPSRVVFNLALPTVFALAAVGLYAMGDLLLPRFRWFPLLTLVLVNPALVRLLLTGGPSGGILWDSTRVITDTINEYTLFSFLWGDAHPHVLDIGNQVFLLLVLCLALNCWYRVGKRGQVTLFALASLSLGSMPVMNTWDVFVYAPLTVLFGLLLLRDGWRMQPRDTSALGLVVAVPLVSVLLYLPYYLQLAATGFLGIFPVTTPSDPWEFLLVNGFFLVVFIAYGARSLIRRPYLLLPAVVVAIAGYPAAAMAVAAATALLARWERIPGPAREPGSSREEEARSGSSCPGGKGAPLDWEGGPSGLDPEILMALAGLAVITFCELFYFRDYLGGIYYRMNTVFKFYNIAWILMGASSMIIIARVLGGVRIPRVPSGQALAAAGIAVAALLVAVPAILAAGGTPGMTLDGLQYLESTHQGDAAALGFVRGLPPGTVIAEGVKGDYGYPSRISSFTGVQTIIGWPGHEFMWRGAGGGAQDRVEEVRAVYEDPSRSPGILRRYNVSYVYVGETERELYPHLNLPTAGLVPAYEGRVVTIYRFTG